MRILIATGIFPPDIGGPATYSKLLAGEFTKRLHEVLVISFGEQNELQTTNYKLQTVSRKLPKGIRHLIYFWNVFRLGLHVDIIYAQDAVSAGFPAALAALILRKRFFLKVVGDYAWEQSHQRFEVHDLLDDFLDRRYGLRVGLLRMVQKFTVRRATCVVVPSAYLQSVVERWGILRERITVIPNAVSLPTRIPAKEEARQILCLEGFVLVTVGRLVPWKGFEMLIELMPEIIKVIPHAKLVIVGDGPEKKELELRIKNYELGEKIIMTGSVSREKLVQYLAAADAFCLNTSYEGFSHQLIEALALGVPVITTNAGGNKEVVRDGENALVAEYNNPKSWKQNILRLHGDEKLRYSLSQKNVDVINTYSVEQMVSKTEFLFHNS